MFDVTGAVCGFLNCQFLREARTTLEVAVLPSSGEESSYGLPVLRLNYIFGRVSNAGSRCVSIVYFHTCARLLGEGKGESALPEMTPIAGFLGVPENKMK